jgi:hypothetical protein
MLGLSLSTLVELLIVFLVPAAMVTFGDRSSTLAARLAAGLGLAAALLFLASVLCGSGGGGEYLIAATVGLGLGGGRRAISP